MRSELFLPPTKPVKIVSRYRDRVKAFYVLNNKLWKWNLATGQQSGTYVGSAPTFTSQYITTSTASGSAVELPINITSADKPYVLLLGYKRMDGGTVPWSMLKLDDSWGGIYATDDGVMWAGIDMLSSYAIDPFTRRQAIRVTSSEVAVSTNGRMPKLGYPTVANVTSPIMALGAAKTAASSYQYLTKANFNYFAYISGTVTDSELIELSRNPYLLLDQKAPVIYFIPTVSSDIYLDGAAVSSGYAVGGVDISISPSGLRLDSYASSSGAITTNIPIIGATLSVSQLSASAIVSHEIVGNAGAVAGGSGELSSSALVSGSAQNLSTDTGILSIDTGLMGSAQNSALSLGSISIGSAINGDIYNIATDTGFLSSALFVDGALQSSATDAALLTINRVISGDAQAIAAVNGVLQATDLLGLSGQINSNSSASGTLSINEGVSGNAQNQSILTGQALVSDAISGSIQGLSSLTGALSGAGNISALAASLSTDNGTATVSLSISGNMLAAASLMGNATLSLPLSGASLSSALMQGGITDMEQGDLAGMANSISLLNGQVDILSSIDGAAGSLGALNGNVSIDANLSGTGASSTMMAGSGGIFLPMVGSISAVASLSGGATINLNVNSIAYSVSNMAGDVVVTMGVGALLGNIIASALMGGVVTIEIPLSGAMLANAIAHATIAPFGSAIHKELSSVLQRNYISIAFHRNTLSTSRRRYN